MDYENGDWKQWKNLVLQNLEELKKQQKETTEDIHKLQIDLYEKLNTMISPIQREVTILKVKAGMYGAIVGLIVSTVVTLITKKLIGG